jgi:hypothetical protein
MTMKTSLLLLFAFVFVAPVCSSQGKPPVDKKIVQGLVAYVKAHHQTPEEYIVSKFKDHDVVFLGEWHWIKHDPILVQHVIPRLAAAEVYFLGLEFARRIDQPLIDSLLSAPDYDEQLARLILFKGFVHWGFQEYADIFKAAWQVNRIIPAGGKKFRILGVGNSPDWSLITKPEDRDDYEVMRKVWHGESEEDWGRVLLDVASAGGEKALVYSGSHHAFTEYRQPIASEGKFIRFGDVRMGNYVFQKIGKRAMTINLHAPWVNVEGYGKPPVFPADGYIDAMLTELDPKEQSVGFDCAGTSFGKLPGETSLYKFGYEGFTLENIYDGYICQGPFSSYEGVTPIKGFINEANLEEARSNSPSAAMRNASAEEFNAGAAEDADIKRRLSALR